ncbi:hypothetical protein [Thermospira aquatica]|uniref:Uncharacterized protein n=1 Tax=Thermospira aquatica TaxID=2828656 RepID=A0AAX3BES1_9SPIR|nr:hypothetical protein [Thermospira aquatica]URA10613.1 hypothetical protein KDW03_02070 [Thermospira aquatica]
MLAFLLFLFVVFLVVDYFRFENDPVCRAREAIMEELWDFHGYEICPDYFEDPPRFVGESNGYLIYGMPSIEPWKGAVWAMVYIPKERKKKIEVVFEGKDKYVDSLRGECAFTYSQLLLLHLFDYNFFTYTGSWWDSLLGRKYYTPYRDVVFDEKTKENLINFGAIKLALLYSGKNFQTLKELVRSVTIFVTKEDIFDPYGREYFYKVQGRYVILGSKGENGKWDFDRETLNKVFSNAEEKLFFVKGDDIIVKILPRE